MFEQNDPDKELKKAFAVFDPERRGYVTVKLMSMIMVNTGIAASPNEAMKLINENDTDFDGTITFNEFREIGKKMKH